MRIRTVLALTAGIVIALASPSARAAGGPGAILQDELGKNWSLFSEYYKIGEYKTAIPFGWKVIRIDSTRFKTVYQKLADCYFNMYQKADSTERQPYADTMLVIYDMGIRTVPERASGMWLLKGYALENYFYGRELEAIDAYEKSRSLDPNGMEMAYIDRLGILYVKNAPSDPSMKMKAVDLYRWAKDKFPNDPLPVQRLKQLVTDPQELIKLAEEDLKGDPDNVEKIWAAATAYRDAEVWDGAERHLLRLTKISPDNLTYWGEYAKVLQRAGKFSSAINAYQTTLQLNSDIKENYLNIAVCYRQLKQFESARTWALRASAKDRTWGAPYMEVGEIYKAAVEHCVMTSKNGDWTKLDLDDKLVYKTAANSFQRARSVDPSLANEALQRESDLRTLVPTREDLFFNQARIVDGKIALTSSCYQWIDPVPVDEPK